MERDFFPGPRDWDSGLLSCQLCNGNSRSQRHRLMLFRKAWLLTGLRLAFSLGSAKVDQACLRLGETSVTLQEQSVLDLCPRQMRVASWPGPCHFSAPSLVGSSTTSWESVFLAGAVRSPSAVSSATFPAAGATKAPQVAASPFCPSNGGAVYRVTHQRLDYV